MGSPTRQPPQFSLLDLVGGVAAFAVACLYLPPWLPETRWFPKLGLLTWHACLCVMLVPATIRDVWLGRAARFGRLGQAAILLAAIGAIGLRFMLPGALDRCNDGESAFAHEPGALLIWMAFFGTGVLAIAMAGVGAIDRWRVRRWLVVLPLLASLPLPIWFLVLGKWIFE